MNARLSLLQRGSALILGPFVLVHLGLILYAIEGGVSADEILGRTQGSLTWAAFYGLFVLAAAIHGPIGVFNIIRETTPWRGGSLAAAMVLFGLLLVVLGIRAVAAVTLP